MAAPPSYSQSQYAANFLEEGLDSTPEYSNPHTFAIGSQESAPLVTVDQIKAHLSLLHLFCRLRSKAEALELPQVLLQPVENLKHRRWSFFVCYAVERFQAWCCSPYLAPVNELDLLLPPIDVLMVWHTYRLNPAWYAEDSARLPALARLESRGGAMFPCLLDPELQGDYTLQRFQESLIEELTYDRREELPSEERMSQWTNLTDMPYDAFGGVMEWTTRTIQCVHCRNQVSAELLNTEGTGYLQSAFKMQCPECGKELNKRALGVAKFAKDFVSNKGTHSSFLAGTLHTPTNPLDTDKASVIKNDISESRLLSRPRSATTLEWEHHIGKGCKWDLAVLFVTVGHRMEFGGGNTIALIKAAYTNEGPFSVDLVGAVLRQATFIEKMDKLGWTDPNCFKTAEDEVALLQAVTRYHTFLDLNLSHPANLLVPTLDIDLAWHTHQLFSTQYGKDTREFVGRFIDHDDRVEDKTLASCFISTCREWEKRFNVPYSTCGCCVSEKKISDKMSQRVSQVFGRKKASSNAHLLPFTQRGNSKATHPSDHNSVAPLPGSKQKPDMARMDSMSDPFWGKPFARSIRAVELADCVAAAARLAHVGPGVEFRANPGLQDRRLNSVPDRAQTAFMIYDSAV